MSNKLLSRDQFRNNVFLRDNYKCVVCGEPAKDAHHILERRLWDDEGYYLDNGVSLCSKCHIKSEQTLISCSKLRELANITRVIIPEYMYQDCEVDKWGNIILSNGLRLKGELFFDESVQKILAPVLDQFCIYVKYPRTYHLPWSGLVTKDDRKLENTDHFNGKEVVVTVKMDGENTSAYSDYIHARSVDSRNHPSRNWVKNLHSQIQFDIPKDWRICGENLFAKHTIEYSNLEDYFLVFSIWNERNICLSWNETIVWCDLLGLYNVPVLYTGTWDEDLIKSLYKPIYEDDRCEGYVVRLADSFSYRDFRHSVAKYVNTQFSEDLKGRHNWSREQIVQNKLTYK